MTDYQSQVLRGIAASPGVAVGVATVMGRDHLPVPRVRITPDEVAEQVRRLRQAIEESRQELEAIRERLGQEAPADYRLILEAHLMMHSDELLIDVATQAIESELVSAEWALDKAVSSIKRHLEQAPDAYFRDRAIDVEHVGVHIRAQLVGRSSVLPPLAADSVLVVDDLHPADVARLIESPVAALVTGLGSATSHTAILAHTLEIPSVVGVTGVTSAVGSGDRIIVDALGACVVLSPDDAACEDARARSQRYRSFTQELRSHGASSITEDGVSIELMANVDLPAEVAMAIDDEVPGVGLYRTEFLFMDRATPPDEEEQYAVYRDIARVARPRPVVIRTFDMGGDSLTLGDERGVTGPNPALGLRAIRLALARPELFRPQLRAILRAATEGELHLMFPLIAGLPELRRARAEVEHARQELEQEGVDHGPVRIGAMIELPSSVIMADHIAPEVDFLAVGTNDLVQYTLAADRTNPLVAYLADSLDPAVLRQLNRLVVVARDFDRSLSMCGDMATHPVALPVVAGLGFRRLSLPLSALPLSREILRAIRISDAESIARRALDCGTVAEVRALVREGFPQLLPIWREAGVIV